MLTTAQRRRRTTMIKAGTVLLLTAVIFIPRLETIAVPDFPFGFIGPAQASKLYK